MWNTFFFFDDDNSGYNFLGGVILLVFSLCVIEVMWSSFIGKVILIMIGLLITGLFKPVMALIKKVLLFIITYILLDSQKFYLFNKLLILL
ncbi:MAG: hypothetical protein RSE57_06660 [Clostridia bacterium]